MSPGREGPVGHEEEADAARTAEELPRRAGEVVAAQALDGDRDLPHGLAGVDQIGHLRRPADLADGLDRLDQARVGGDPGEGDERGPAAADEARDRFGVDAAFGQHPAPARPRRRGAERARGT